MNIGSYTFEEFKQRAKDFHGYPAPGVILGGYMVAMAKAALPSGTLFEAVVETKKCLPDAVQVLTVCSTGNNWLRVVDLGKYAVSLYDKYTGEGVRVYVDVAKLAAYPEIRAWFLKEKPKSEQDTEKLFIELEDAGDSICSMNFVRIFFEPKKLGKMQGIVVCPHCKEAYPEKDGSVCRGCQGENPYEEYLESTTETAKKVVPVAEAIGKKALHDMTRIVPGESKGALFSAGQEITAGDVCRLQQMGRFFVAVDDGSSPQNAVHENICAEAFAKRMAGENVIFSLPPREGKVTLKAHESGLLCVSKERLRAFNMVPDVMCASRQDGAVVTKGMEIAGTRALPLYLSKVLFGKALSLLELPLFSILPFRKAKVGILVTGTEVFQGLVQDKFIPTISKKVEAYNCTVVATYIVPDDKKMIREAVLAIQRAGADLLITTGGLSVDPDDLTKDALKAAGMHKVLFGAPVLPGTMSLVGIIGNESEFFTEKAGCGCEYAQPGEGEMQVIGVPACALYFETTFFDILLPWLLAGRVITRRDLADMSEGGFCANCATCTYPRCSFVK